MAKKQRQHKGWRTVVARSVAWEDVRAAIREAPPGARIEIPAGEATWPTPDGPIDVANYGVAEGTTITKV